MIIATIFFLNVNVKCYNYSANNLRVYKLRLFINCNIFNICTKGNENEMGKDMSLDKRSFYIIRFIRRRGAIYILLAGAL